MQKIELKKVDNKIALDTKVEGCWDDCIHSYVAGSNAAQIGGYSSCRLKVWRSPKACITW